MSALAEGIKNVFDVAGSDNTMQSKDTVIYMAVPTGVEFKLGKPVAIDSMMNIRTRIRHPSYYSGSSGSGYDRFNEDIKRQKDSVWNSRN